jgi:glycosyltransferase involved in cell wall biosynthesis
MPVPAIKASSIRVLNEASALAAGSPDIAVRIFAYRGSADQLVSDRLELVTVGGGGSTKAPYYSWRKKLLLGGKLLLAMMRARSSIDVIHCHTYEGLGIALLFKTLVLSPAPICVDIHGPLVPELVHYGLIPNRSIARALFRYIERLMLRRAGHVFVSNEGLKTVLGPLVGDDRVTIVFDYVNLESFATDRIDPNTVALARARFKPKGERIIAYVGMFKDYQGVDYLIRAFGELARQDPQLRLLLVGDGPCREQYEMILAEVGLGGRVIMPGLIPHAEVVQYLEIADIVVSPRIDNDITKAGFVSQMPEYMAAGKLIVSTGVSGCRFLLRDQAGIVVEPNSVPALRAGLERALALSPQDVACYAANARRNAHQFTWAQGIQDVRRTYETLTGRDRQCAK